ncbi:MAG: conserved membrane protein of unknown function [Promethearchaeota archaeon]|nr:MAG: conserved membrane protein of unknown function [Candidatus Lokiarchaeota archaeon]
MARLSISIIVGVFLSFLGVSLFDQWGTFNEALIFSNGFKIISELIGAVFEFDIITFFMAGPYDITAFFVPSLLACIFISFIIGTIAKGLRRGIIASLLCVVVDLLLWILFSIFSGEDLMALFQGRELIATLGGIFSALFGMFIGGALGGFLSGPYEEFF